MKHARRSTAIGLCLLALFPTISAQTVKDLSELSLEELLNTRITSAARKPQSLRTTAAAAFVITSDDIRRSGLHTLPEVLRLAPGVQVARIETGVWAISIRGFNDDFANKLLVLVDGRSIYNEVWSGVYWNLQDMPLDNIERIEVIRGPGAAMWGVNAVNGVINIITKSAGDTQGTLIATEAGTETETNNRARYGGRIGSKAAYRIGARESSHEALHGLGADISRRGWSSVSMDFRIDWNLSPRDSLLISGLGYRSELGHAFVLPTGNDPFPPLQDVREQPWDAYLLANWQRRFSDRSSIEARLSWERTDNGDANISAIFIDREFEFQQRVGLGSRQDLLWGASLHAGVYDVMPHSTFRIVPRHTNADIFSTFAADEISLVRDRLYLTLGVQTGHHYASGFEVQPTARLSWIPRKNLTSWAAISRAVRTPSLGERGFDATVAAFPLQPPLFGLLHIQGDPAIRPETMLAYEAGQRMQLGQTASLDVSAFYNVHQHVISRAAGTPHFVPPGPADLPHLDIPVLFANAQQARSYGAEVSASWEPVPRWKLLGGYSWLRVQGQPYPGITLRFPSDQDGSSPQHQWELRSQVDVTRRLDFDTSLYYYAAIPAMSVPGFLRGDLRLGWRPSDTVEFSAGVQNAFDAEHYEFESTRLQAWLGVRRNVYGALAWKF